MSRVAEIKQRSMEAFYDDSYADKDIEYLLSKLETVEKKLVEALEGDGVIRQYEEVAEDYTQLSNAVKDALQQLRE